MYARHLKQTCFDYVKFNSEGKNAMYEEIGVSIITPAYNSDEFLPTTIDSVLNQSHQLFELIIIEDMGSKPTSLNITDPRIRILKNTLERGAGVARYVGIKNSKYPLIAFIDSDDIWHKTKLADQIEYMKKFDMSFSFTGYQTSKNNNSSFFRWFAV